MKILVEGFLYFDRWNWQSCLHTKLVPTLNDIRSIIKKISLTISVHTNNKIDIIINYYLQNVPIFTAANTTECHNMKCKYWKYLREILRAMILYRKCHSSVKLHESSQRVSCLVELLISSGLYLSLKINQFKCCM